MHRFFAEALDGDLARLSAEEAAHAARVLRLEAGDEAELLMAGRRFAAVFTALKADGAELRVLRELPSTEPRLRVTLYQGLPKADKLEWIIQKAVELGVHSVVPAAMARSVVRLSPADGAKKQPRWQKIAQEAAKQSGRCILPEVREPVSFAAMVRELADFDAAAVPYEEALGNSLRSFHAAHPALQRVAVVIGPEGGISAEEMEALQAAGGEAVTLGPRILRTETAGLCALSALMCLYGEMEDRPANTLEG